MDVSSLQAWSEDVSVLVSCRGSGLCGLCVAYATAQRNRVLQELRLKSNQIGADGAKALAEALKVRSDTRADEQLYMGLKERSHALFGLECVAALSDSADRTFGRVVRACLRHFV